MLRRHVGVNNALTVTPANYTTPDSSSATSGTGSCTDNAGNTATDVSDTFMFDATNPTVAVNITSSANGAGWFNSAVSFSASCSDATSGVNNALTVTPGNYTGPDGNPVFSGTGSCTDNAGNTATDVSDGFKYDASGPTTTVVIDRVPDHNGWYNHTVTFTTQCVDAGSGVNTSLTGDATDYSGPDDTAVTSDQGSCTDNAGNTTYDVSDEFDYDGTAPVATVGIDDTPNGAGWFKSTVHFTTTGTDNLSGIENCTDAADYSGPDGTGLTSGTATCTDNAGNTSATDLSDTFKYDATKPVATVNTDDTANAFGWFNSTVHFTTTGTDNLSGVANCTDAPDYSGPDGTSLVSGTATCTDNAGNTSLTDVSNSFNYDATNPSATVNIVSTPNGAGWFNSAVSFSITCSDVTSGVNISLTVTPGNYTGPDGNPVHSDTGSCTDYAGNTATDVSDGLKYDGTAPTATVSIDRLADHNGWYNHTVTFTTTCFDATSGENATLTTDAADYSGPDGTGLTSATATCTDNAGNTSATDVSDTFKYDATKPVATVNTDRLPDSNGWYNHTVTFTTTGTDNLSGVDACTDATDYSGPDGTSLVSGTATCTDNAGNTSLTDVSNSFNYDATAPVATVNITSSPNGAGWFNSAVSFSVGCLDNLSGEDVTLNDPPANYTGPDGNPAYSDDGYCTDLAGNTSDADQSDGFKFDATAPTATVTITSSPNGAGWFNSAVSFSTGCYDATSGVNSTLTTTPANYIGPDGNPVYSGQGSCTDNAGNTGYDVSDGFKFDATKPTATVNITSVPNGAGWFRTPVAFSVSCLDNLSGENASLRVAPANYSGPDGNPVYSGNGTCTDNAGNTSLPDVSDGFKYDATNPSTTVNITSVPNGAGWFKTPVAFSTSCSDVTSGVNNALTVTPANYSGPDGSSVVSANGSCTDNASNSSSATSAAFMFDATNPTLARARRADRTPRALACSPLDRSPLTT